jgi:hypothetical protein
VTRKGATYQQDVSNIGKAAKTRRAITSRISRAALYLSAPLRATDLS